MNVVIGSVSLIFVLIANSFHSRLLSRPMNLQTDDEVEKEAELSFSVSLEFVFRFYFFHF